MLAQAAAPVSLDFRMTRTYRLLVRGKNVNQETLLCTDYLNHFNEVVMLIELVGSMPECMEDLRSWRPKSYADHFHDSSFADRELAILAYENAPSEHRDPFDRTVELLDKTVAAAILELDAAVGGDNQRRIEAIAERAAARLHALIDVAGGIINGHQAVIDQSQIDALLDVHAPVAAIQPAAGNRPRAAPAEAADPSAAFDQSDIDALFDAVPSGGPGTAS